MSYYNSSTGIPSATPLGNLNQTPNSRSPNININFTRPSNNSNVELTEEQKLEIYKNRFIDTCNKLYDEYIEPKQSYKGIEYICLNEEIETITPSNFSYEVEKNNKLFKNGDKVNIKRVFDESIHFLDRNDLKIKDKIEVLLFYIEEPIDKLYKTIIFIFDCEYMFGREIFYRNLLRDEYRKHYRDLATLYFNYNLSTNLSLDFEDHLINYGAHAFLKFILQKRNLIHEWESKGSRRIGQGAYGKVYRSPIGYDDKSQIGKVFSTFSSWDSEYNIAEKLRELPNDDEFIVLPKSITQMNKKVLQLRYGYAGESYKDYLNRYSNTNSPKIIIRRTNKSIKIMCNFLKRYLDTFGKSELTHLDIKPANVMYLEDDNTLRLIDFSLTTNEENLFNRNPRRRIMIESSYPFWSPEYNLFMAGFKGREIDIDTIKKLTNATIGYFRNRIFKNKVKNSMDILFRKYNKDSTYIFVKNSQDSWGIGMTFLLYLDTIYTKKSFSRTSVDLKQGEDFIEKVVDIICKNILCVNTDRSIESCIKELESISGIQGLNNVRTLFDNIEYS